jgi:polysaccharide export outer membrane protein
VRLAGVLLAGVLLAGSGCRTPSGAFTWVDALPPQELGAAAAAEGYSIHAGDVIAVRVFNQDAMSARARVRPDGRISLPFLKDVVVAGLTPNALAEQLQTRLRNFINNPVVTVSLEETPALLVPVMGEVVRPGSVTLEPGSTVLAALAAAGGLNDYAHEDGIFVLRQGPTPQRIRFRYEALARNEGAAAQFRLQRGDAIVVE